MGRRLHGWAGGLIKLYPPHPSWLTKHMTWCLQEPLIPVSMTPTPKPCLLSQFQAFSRRRAAQAKWYMESHWRDQSQLVLVCCSALVTKKKKKSGTAASLVKSERCTKEAHTHKELHLKLTSTCVHNFYWPSAFHLFNVSNSHVQALQLKLLLNGTERGACDCLCIKAQKAQNKENNTSWKLTRRSLTME